MHFMPAGARPKRGRVGRTPGSPQNREAIRAAALAEFTKLGYDRATIRDIAAAAGVDPALVLHYFGSKDQLLVAALEFPVNPRELISELLAGGVEGLSERLLRRALSVWTSEQGGGPMVGLIRSAASHDEAARMMKEFFAREVLGRVVKSLGTPQPELRAALVASQMIGLAMARFVIRFEPIASASIDDMVSWYAPTLQRYLTGPLAGDTVRTRRTSAIPAGPVRRPRIQPPSRSPSPVAPSPRRARRGKRAG
jgi:AcrR family transcriptional regulator